VGRTAAGPDTDGQLEVRFPELPITAYLRVLSWGGAAMAALLAEPTLEAVARANGVHILDRDVQRLSSLGIAALCESASRTVRAGATTMSPSVTAPYRVWSSGIATSERLFEWTGRLRGSNATGFPAPSREVRSVWSNLLTTARQAYATVP
jgi:hypothetical protein